MEKIIIEGYLTNFKDVQEMVDYEDYDELTGALVDVEEKYGVYEFDFAAEVFCEED